jgi:hypothetical protein
LTTYRAWTAKAVEHRVIEAAETLMLMPNVQGPRNFVSLMPETIQDWHAYGSEPSTYKVRPSRDAIGRMPETWSWINAHPSEEDRRLLYAWAWVKTRKGKSVNDFASREGHNNRTLRRQITRICQAIANELNRKHSVRLTIVVDVMSEITAEADPEQISSVKYANHWRTDDAKPRHLPEMLERTPAKRAG